MLTHIKSGKNNFQAGVSESMNSDEMYKQLSFGNKIGFGNKPALILVDFIKGCTDPELPLGFNQDAEIENTNKLRQLFTKNNWPVVLSTVVYDDPDQEAKWFLKKVPMMRNNIRGSVYSEFDPRLLPTEGDIVIEKHFASVFNQTNLKEQLDALRVDTLIITGNSTSGCVRASCVDAIANGYRPMVVKECVSDRVEEIHLNSLFDINSKYGDVVSIDEVFEFYRNEDSVVYN